MDLIFKSRIWSEILFTKGMLLSRLSNHTSMDKPSSFFESWLEERYKVWPCNSVFPLCETAIPIQKSDPKLWPSQCHDPSVEQEFIHTKTRVNRVSWSITNRSQWKDTKKVFQVYSFLLLPKTNSSYPIHLCLLLLNISVAQTHNIHKIFIIPNETTIIYVRKLRYTKALTLLNDKKDFLKPVI